MRPPLLFGVLALAALAAATPARSQAPGPPVHMEAGTMTVERGPAGDIVYLNGGVKLTRGHTVITGDRGRYLRTQSIFFLDDHVNIVDSTTVITCDHLAYHEDLDVADLRGSVTVLDRDGLLTGDQGTYDRARGRAELVGNVTAQDKEQRMTADTLIYLRATQKVQARGHVVGVTTQEDLELRAQRMDFDRTTRWADATGDPVLRSREKDGRLTYVYAQLLRLNTETRVAEAVDSVRMVRDTLQARADRALFDDRAEHGYLLGNPRAWDNETRLQGDTLEIFTRERALQRLVMRGRASADYTGLRPTTVGEVSLLTGSLIDVYFAHDEIDSVVATGQARNFYQSVPRPGQMPETNRAEGDTITIFFKDGKLDRARVQGQARGEYHLAVASGDTLAAEREIVRYDALGIEYRVPEDRIVLDGKAHLRYREMELNSKRVEFDSGDETLVATGSPQLVDRGESVAGNAMTYDMGTRTGMIFDATTRYERGLYHGARIRKAGENLLEVLHGSYSTCDLADPHYHFYARWMKIYLKDKLVAKPVVFYVKNVPFFALPFYIFPIKPGRHSGFLFPQFEFGLNSSAGQFIRNAGYYWAVNDYLDLTFSGDYYQAEPSWVMRTEGIYKLIYVLDGRFNGTFARSERDQRDRWDMQAWHSQVLSDRSNFTAQGNFVSSREYARDNLFGRNLQQRVNRFLVSSVAYSHRADWASISMVVDRRQDLDADEALNTQPPPAIGREASLSNLTQTLPSVSLLLPTRTIGSLGLIKGTPLESPLRSLYFGLSSRFVSFEQRRAFVTGYNYAVDTLGVPVDSSAAIGQRVTTRRGATTDASLSDARRLFGWLNLTPALSGRAALFDHDEAGNKNSLAGVWNGAVTTSATFYGAMRRRIGRLEGIRHVVFPSVSFSYSPEFPGLRLPDGSPRYSGFAGIDISGGARSQQFHFGLDQRLQVKWRRREEVLRLDNLLTWSINGSYNPLYRSQGQAHPLSALSSAVRLQPPGAISADLSWIHDVYRSRPVRNLNLSVGVNFAGGGSFSATPDLPLGNSAAAASPFTVPWSVGVSYSYAGGRLDNEEWSSNQRANAVLRSNLSPNWHLDYTNSYDVTNHLAVSQEFTLVRDLHCWQLRLSRRFTGGEEEYYFRFGIKDQPEIYLERGSRGVGSLGGLQ